MALAKLVAQVGYPLCNLLAGLEILQLWASVISVPFADYCHVIKEKSTRSY